MVERCACINPVNYRFTLCTLLSRRAIEILYLSDKDILYKQHAAKDLFKEPRQYSQNKTKPSLSKRQTNFSFILVFLTQRVVVFDRLSRERFLLISASLQRKIIFILRLQRTMYTIFRDIHFLIQACHVTSFKSILQASVIFLGNFIIFCIFKSREA